MEGKGIFSIFEPNFEPMIYFASDLHLGVPNKAKSLEREKRFVAFLDSIKADAQALYLLGDIFDMWFEYKRVIPRGYSRLFGKLAELSDQGIEIHYFIGNHDMWVFNYFQEEFNIQLHRQSEKKEILGKVFFLSHGDGLGSGDLGYKFIKAIFRSPISQWLYARLHPNFALGLADRLSRRSRAANAGYDEIFEGEEKESSIQFAKNMLKTEDIDFFVMGHRHLALDIELSPKSKYINLGEWVKGSQYAVFNGEELILKKFTPPNVVSPQDN